MNNGLILGLMTLLFLGLGYLGVPVAFALMAGVLAATALTPVSFPSIIGQMFHGIDSEALLAVPFFLLVGELMTSAEVTQRMIVLSQTLVGHLRGGPRALDRLTLHVAPRVAGEVGLAQAPGQLGLGLRQPGAILAAGRRRALRLRGAGLRPLDHLRGHVGELAILQRGCHRRAPPRACRVAPRPAARRLHSTLPYPG